MMLEMPQDPGTVASEHVAVLFVALTCLSVMFPLYT